MQQILLPYICSFFCREITILGHYQNCGIFLKWFSFSLLLGKPSSENLYYYPAHVPSISQPLFFKWSERKNLFNFRSCCLGTRRKRPSRTKHWAWMPNWPLSKLTLKIWRYFVVVIVVVVIVVDVSLLFCSCSWSCCCCCCRCCYCCCCFYCNCW